MSTPYRLTDTVGHVSNVPAPNGHVENVPHSRLAYPNTLSDQLFSVPPAKPVDFQRPRAADVFADKGGHMVGQGAVGRECSITA